MQKSLDRKLDAIHADPAGCREFILADAKDADMAFGVGAPGHSPERYDGELRFKTLADYREQIRQIIRSEFVDIMLMSTSTSEQMTLVERLFENSPVTPAARANDTTDIHILRGGRIHAAPSHPFRTASLDHIQCGELDCSPEDRSRGANLGLYSITFNNDPERDRIALEHFKAFREEAERKGFRYFLEIFDPNVPDAVRPETLGAFINDAIARTLAGVAQAGRPLFLKIVYHGPRALEELVRYDPHLVVGILGGSAGTTRDAFQLLHDARKYGGRVALFGRKINNAENQLAFVQFLRLIADGQLEPEEAVRAYHSVLKRLQIPSARPLDVDLQITDGSMSYGGSTTTISLPRAEPSKPATGSQSAARRNEPPLQPAAGASTRGPVDLAKMSSEERLQYHRDRLNRMLGEG
ncbi:MAG: hypothetical protein EHM42_00965 [Planctomycetaceae bacterium]|nr:MAG: hypothetical protein EHM42_00965 [Planctomycetaceae bacterium]